MLFHTPGGSIELNVTSLFIAGWTGRDMAAVNHHIEELKELGVAPPSTVPLYYRGSSNLLLQANKIQALSEGSSGEAEPFVVLSDGKYWLGLGSDHTDRPLEAFSVAHSKQNCAKPVADTVWPLEEVTDHLDQLELKSWIKEEGDWIAYQEGTLASIRPLKELIEGIDLPENGGMLCGTLPAIGGVRGAAAFRMELNDPVLGRKITTEYEIETLPVVA